MPLIRDNVQTAFIYMGILALDAFVYMAALEPGGGPSNTTLVMSQQLFTTAFTKGQFGYACAMGVVLAVITLAYAGLVFAVNRLTGGTQRGRRMTQTSATTSPRSGAGRRDSSSRPGCRDESRRSSPGDKVDRRGLAHRPDPLVAAGDRPAALGDHVVVQDQLGDLRLAVRAAGRS